MASTEQDLPQPAAGPGVEREFGDEAARVALAALAGPYLPWGSGAMRPAGLVMVCNDIVLHDRRRVVELGSGLSTVLLARLLAQRGGAWALVAVEHDAGWARWVREQLEREGIGEPVTVIDAPLTPRSDDTAGLWWYDEAALTDGLGRALGDDTIELLVVDGPPAYAAGHGLGRYPALPVLRSRLAPDATVVLDDVERPGEQALLRRWESETDLVFDRHAATAGVAITRVP